MRFKYTHTLMLLSILIVGCSLNETEDQLVIEARTIIEQSIADSHIAGLSITVIKDGTIRWSEGFGLANLENETKVDPTKTMFRIGSVSKPFTSTAAAILVEDGRLDLGANILDYVDYFPAKKYPITVKQVAGHMSGIRHYNYATEGEYINKKRYESVKESLNIFKDDTLAFEPGTQFKYSSFGYNTLAAIIEGASGGSFLDYLQNEIFDPVGMLHTSPDYLDSIIVGRAGTYEYDTINQKFINTEYADNSYKWAGGGFLSSSEDIAKFGWAYHHNEIITDSIKQIFIEDQQLTDGTYNHYALGWTDVGTDSYGNRSYGHGGTAVGGKATLRIYLDDDLIIAMAMNTWKSPGDREMLQQIANIFIKE